MGPFDTITLLAHLLKGNHDAFIRHLAARGPDFTGFGDLLAKHQLREFVYSALAASPAADTLPPALTDSLKRAYIRQRARIEQMLGELKLLSSTLSLAGQEFILLKGPYLAKRFYADLDRRAFWDIDILVQREELGNAQRHLISAGFARRSRILFNEQLTVRFGHAFDFAKSGIAVDLHWALRNRPSYRFDYRNIWKAKQEFWLDDVRFYVLSDQHALVFTLVSTFNDIEVAKLRLRSLVDLYMMVRALHGEVDWDRFLEDRRTENIFKISVNVLNLFLRVFDCNRDFPDLARAIDRRRSELEGDNPVTIETLVSHSRVGMSHRLWASRLYEISRLRLLFWWMISMPFRRAAFRAGKSARLKSDLRRIMAKIGLTS